MTDNASRRRTNEFEAPQNRRRRPGRAAPAVGWQRALLPRLGHGDRVAFASPALAGRRRLDRAGEGSRHGRAGEAGCDRMECQRPSGRAGGRDRPAHGPQGHRSSELVAQDASSFGRLQVDSAAGRWLRVFHSGKPVLQLIVGARASDYQSVYLRRPGDANVYVWRGPLAGLTERRADDWRDKRIAALVPDSITALDVERGKDRYDLKRAGKAWTLNGGATDSGAVHRYLDRLKSITAAGFAAPKEVDSTKALRPKRRLSVRGRGGLLLSLTFDSTATGFVVRHLGGVAAVGGEGATVYRMNTWDVDGITPASRSLEPTKPATPTKPK